MRKILAFAAALALFASPLLAVTETIVTLKDKQAYSAGPYLAYLAPWGAGSLVQGADYTESARINPAAFPGNTTMSWDWPQKPCASVCGFHAIDFGDYDNTAVPAPITSKQVKAISTLDASHHLTIVGQADGFDVIDDLFLTSGAGSDTSKLFEIEAFLHTPAYSYGYVASSKRVGTFVDPAGRSWTVATAAVRTWTDILVMPADRADIASGSLDLKAMLVWLTAKGVITGNEYFNGMAIGVEPRFGAGTLSINTFAVTYK